MTAATLWYRGSVIERKSESEFASSWGVATAASPGERKKSPRSGTVSQKRYAMSLPSTRAPSSVHGWVNAVRSTPCGVPPIWS